MTSVLISDVGPVKLETARVKDRVLLILEERPSLLLFPQEYEVSVSVGYSGPLPALSVMRGRALLADIFP
jgi:hypothetical protein